MRSFDEVAESYQKCNAWGLSMTCDLKNCQEILVKSRSAIKSFVDQLIQIIDMKKYGDIHIVHFGQKEEVAGFSFFQLIETSNVSGHLVDKTRNVYLDICSCKIFDPWKVEEFSRNYWVADETEMSIQFR